MISTKRATAFATLPTRRIPSRFTRSLAATALTMLGGLAASGCEDDVKYGYFSVKVTIAETATTDYLARVSGCGVNVEGADTDFATLPCQLGRVTRDLGTFEWSTTSIGTVRFVVRLTDITDKEIGTGTSGDIAIKPGDDVPVPSAVVVVPDPAALMPR